MLTLIFRLLGANSNDPSDPVYRSYLQLFKTMVKLLIVVIAVAFAIVVFGVPSIQGDYRYPRGVKSPPSATEKSDADYWNPVTGWKTVRAGRYSPGCPMLVFMPLRDCMNLQPYKNNVTTRVFGKEFFDGP